MSKKEALRDLQQRLASRLNAAREATDAPAAWLAVEVAGHGFLFPLAEAGEIFPVQGVTPVPHAVPWLLGVASLRGNLHTVVDLARFIGLPAHSARPELQDQARLVTLNASLQTNAALRVDTLLGLRHAGQMPARAPVQPFQPAFAGPRHVDTGGRVWQVLSLAELAASEHFLNVRAAA